MQYNRFYNISHFVNASDGDFLVVYTNCDTSGDYATEERLLCTSISDVLSAVESKLQEFAHPKSDEIHPEYENVFYFDNKFVITFKMDGDHRNDNFTTIKVKGPLRPCDMESLDALANKIIKYE